MKQLEREENMNQEKTKAFKDKLVWNVHVRKKSEEKEKGEKSKW